MKVEGQELCFSSSYISDDFRSIQLVIFNTCLFGQWQLLLTTLIYAVTAICDPFKAHLFRSAKFIPITAIFTILPSCFVSPTILALFTSKTCLTLSHLSTSFPFLFCLMTYLSLFGTASAYYLLRIHRASKNHSSSTSEETVKLARAVQRNFVSLMLLVAVIDVIPVVTVIVCFGLTSGTSANNILSIIIQSSAVCISLYSSMTTVITIAVTKPFRRKTANTFGRILCFLKLKRIEFLNAVESNQTSSKH
uniref:G_PROTEIN_RECEP_F1_2 domain-containing protein n=1 Tax=Steinernema glaseri TaxID=37863 RepID=A0A1I7ZBQ5_9BILA